jgi:hypothetical protein
MTRINHPPLQEVSLRTLAIPRGSPHTSNTPEMGPYTQIEQRECHNKCSVTILFAFSAPLRAHQRVGGETTAQWVRNRFLAAVEISTTYALSTTLMSVFSIASQGIHFLAPTIRSTCLRRRIRCLAHQRRARVGPETKDDAIVRNMTQ